MTLLSKGNKLASADPRARLGSDNYHCLWADKPRLAMTWVDEAADAFKRWECWVNLLQLFQVAHHFGFPPRISSLGEIQSVTVRDQIFHHWQMNQWNVCYCILLCSPLILIPPLNARFNLIAPSKILNFRVSRGCLWSVWEVSGGVKHCLDSVWAEGEGFLPVFFIIVS